MRASFLVLLLLLLTVNVAWGVEYICWDENTTGDIRFVCPAADGNAIVQRAHYGIGCTGNNPGLSAQGTLVGYDGYNDHDLDFCGSTTQVAASVVDEGGGWYRFTVNAPEAGLSVNRAYMGTLSITINGYTKNLGIKFASPDLDGSGTVNLTDTVIFSTLKSGPYDYHIDFNGDGAVNLSDTVIYADHLGHSCD